MAGPPDWKRTPRPTPPPAAFLALSPPTASPVPSRVLRLSLGNPIPASPAALGVIFLVAVAVTLAPHPARLSGAVILILAVTIALPRLLLRDRRPSSNIPPRGNAVYVRSLPAAFGRISVPSIPVAPPLPRIVAAIAVVVTPRALLRESSLRSGRSRLVAALLPGGGNGDGRGLFPKLQGGAAQRGTRG